MGPWVRPSTGVLGQTVEQVFSGQEYMSGQQPMHQLMQAPQGTQLNANLASNVPKRNFPSENLDAKAGHGMVRTTNPSGKDEWKGYQCATSWYPEWVLDTNGNRRYSNEHPMSPGAIAPGIVPAANVSNVQTPVVFGQVPGANLAANVSRENLQSSGSVVQGEVWGLGQNSGQNTQWGYTR
jgi:hypothetical protein